MLLLGLCINLTSMSSFDLSSKVRLDEYYRSSQVSLGKDIVLYHRLSCHSWLRGSQTTIDL